MHPRPLRIEVPGLRLLASGKVREVYEVDAEHLLFVASDRISAFDRVMATAIPGKGAILTQISLFWFDLLRDVCPHHLVSADVDEMPKLVTAGGEAIKASAGLLRGRSMLVRRLRILPVEAIVRGYLAGSGFKEYRGSGTVCGIRLPGGLAESAILPEPLYTPSTKAELGAHDENISPERAAAILGPHAQGVADAAVALYRTAAAYARTRGIIIADTKFEFGLDESGELTLGDEVLTPDSSRFWPAASYAPGRSQDSFDKQYLRDWLESVRFDKNGPGIALPGEVVERTRAKYIEAFTLLTGRAPAL